MKCLLWLIPSGFLSLYVFLLPYLANKFDSNDNNLLCSSHVYCADGSSYYNKTGNLIGCGCGQGIFGQNICSITTFGYTISGYIATAPATGAMASLSALPIAAIWLYGTGSSTIYSRIIPKKWFWISTISLTVFQICYILFLQIFLLSNQKFQRFFFLIW